jgi:hypothetical protein
MLLPENVMKKQVDFLIACFFLASVLFFFTTGRFDLAQGLNLDDFSHNEHSYTDFEREFTAAQVRAVEREVQREMRFRIAEILAEQGLFAQEICTSVNISDSHSISISEVRLVFAVQGDEPGDEELAMLRDAIHIIQKEVGERVLVTGEIKNQG